MAKKYLDINGLLYFWDKLKGKFVLQETGKGLSTNDYTTAEKEKLAGIEVGANKTVVENVLTSTSTTNALSAAQGKELLARIDAINTNLEDLGAGDMLKSVYDVDGDGVVDKAGDSNKLGGQLPAYYAKASDIPVVTNDLTDALKANYDAAYAHSQTTHAPSDAEKNVIVTVKQNGVELIPDGDRSVDITVPTKVSELENDAGYLTSHQDISSKADKSTTLAGYGIGDAYTKTETDNAIQTAIANAEHLTREVVESVPDASTAKENVIYMVKDDSAIGDVYKEYMLINGEVIQTGDTSVDLTDYVKASDIETITNEEIEQLFI